MNKLDLFNEVVAGGEVGYITISQKLGISVGELTKLERDHNLQVPVAKYVRPKGKSSGPRTPTHSVSADPKEEFQEGSGYHVRYWLERGMNNSSFYQSTCWKKRT